MSVTKTLKGKRFGTVLLFSSDCLVPIKGQGAIYTNGTLSFQTMKGSTREFRFMQIEFAADGRHASAVSCNGNEYTIEMTNSWGPTISVA